MSPAHVDKDASAHHSIRCPYIATDIIIEHEQAGVHGIVLIERANPPSGLALPGGFAEYGLSLEENALKEAKEETGLDVRILVVNHPFRVSSDPRRDPRAHVISVAYIAKGTGILAAGDDAKLAALYTLPEIWDLIPKPVWAFPDHAFMLKSFIMDYAIHRETYPEMAWLRYGK